MNTTAGLAVVALLLVAVAGARVVGEEKDAPEVETITVATSDGVKLRVEVAGQGRPCLFLHGGPGAGSDWMRKLSNGLFEKHFRMVYLDQRGAGASTSPAGGDYSMDRMVADFEEVREALGIEKWMTMGHSFGGILQMGYVERHPEAVTGMIMLNCSLDLNDSFESSWIPRAVEILGIADPAHYLDRSVPREERIMALIEMMQEKGVFWKHIYLRQESEAVMAATNAGVPRRNQDLQHAALAHEDYQKDFRPATANVKAPVLFFYGRADWLVGPEHYKGVRFPDVMLYGSEVSHFPMIERRDDLDEAIAKYLEKYKL